MKDPKQEILGQAKELFQRLGYHKTTLTDIARGVGKVKTALYYYFGNKQEIFNQVVRMESLELYHRLEKEVGKASDPMERLEVYMQTRFRLIEELLKRYLYLKEEVFEMIPMIEANRKEALNLETQLVESILAEGQQQGTFEVESPEKAAQLLVNALKGMEIQMFVTGAFPMEDTTSLSNFLLYGAIRPKK